MAEEEVLRNINKLDEPISEEEVLRNINKLKNNKSPGADMTVNKYMCTQTKLLPMYVKLFNKIFDNGVMPSEWLVGLTVPRYKNKGDTHDVNNSRGIPLLSCLGKPFTFVLSEILTEYSNFIKFKY